MQGEDRPEGGLQQEIDEDKIGSLEEARYLIDRYRDILNCTVIAYSKAVSKQDWQIRKLQEEIKTLKCIANEIVERR